MNVPMPGGIVVTSTAAPTLHDDINERASLTTPRNDATASAAPLRQQQQQDHHHHHRSSSSSSSSSRNSRNSSGTATTDNDNSTTSSSVQSAAQNNVHSFDDQGRSSSYLQFFKSPPPPPPPLLSTSTASLQQQQHRNAAGSTAVVRFELDVYSTDRTTRTPLQFHHRHPPPSAAAAAAAAILQPLQQQQEQVVASASNHSSSTGSNTCKNNTNIRRSNHQKMKTKSVQVQHLYDHQRHNDRTPNALFAQSTAAAARANPTFTTTTTAPPPPFMSPCPSLNLYDDQHVSHDRRSWEASEASFGSEDTDTAATKENDTDPTLQQAASTHSELSASQSSASAATTATESMRYRVGDDTGDRGVQLLLTMSSSSDDHDDDDDSSSSSSQHQGFLRNFFTRASSTSTRGVLRGTRNSSAASSASTSTSTTSLSYYGGGNNNNSNHHETTDNLSVLSSASHLFGETFVGFAEDVGQQQHQNNRPHAHNNNNTGLTSLTQSETLSHSHSSSHNLQQQQRSNHHGHDTAAEAVWMQGLSNRAQDVWIRVRSELRDRLPQSLIFFGRSDGAAVGQRPPLPLLSPRLRNLSDLRYLTAQHKQKCAQLLDPDDETEDFFDMVLVLQPQKVYGFWAELLDFRVELLGQEVVDAMQEHWGGGDCSSNSNFQLIGGGGSSSYSSQQLQIGGSRSTETNESDSEDGASVAGSEAQDVFTTTTPLSGVRRRRGTTPLNTTTTTPGSTRMALGTAVPRTNSKRSLVSPGIYSCYNDSSILTTTVKKQSMFERALESPAATSFAAAAGDSTLLDTAEQPVATSTTTTTPALPAYRRRWGNHVGSGKGMLTMMSPPVHSLTRQKSLTERFHNKPNARLPPSNTDSALAAPRNDASDDIAEADRDSSILRLKDIPNQVIARGIAARTNRTNGMLPFLSALKRGIVLRRHRPTQEAAFCKISSTDGGDTIIYQSVDYQEAMIAFKEQRVRYNKNDVTAVLAEAQHWSLDKGNNISDTAVDENAVPNNFSVPDYVAADAYRKRMAKEGCFGRKVTELATKVVGSGTAKVADIVAVHPARNKDPRSDTGELGSTSLRRSKSDYSVPIAFSLVTLRGNKKRENMEEHEAKWHQGEGNEAQFKYIDFEAATEGEYWLVFRGLLLLHRDAAVGRFAKQRAAGIGTNVESSDLSNRLHKDEFHEPLTVGWLERAIVNCRNLDTTYMEGFITKEGAVPPPSDYFLGFRSPGTAIWSRLRQAGLETRRVYSLDPNRVMIKIRCPSDRLMDVAEVLRMKLKTKDGSFAPFREDMIDVFDSMDDPLEGPPPQNMHYQCDFQFRSSIRQTIIDFIIGSRIRDSGAELGQTTELGQLIQARVPLHMHGKLNAIYDSWFYFWRVENWSQGRNGSSLSHTNSGFVNRSQLDSGQLTLESGDSERSKKDGFDDRKMPNFFTRFFVGCMYQPLDSIETYFGEKVAFYFTWLQHTAAHLVFLSIAGLFLFLCQLGSGKVDHPLRPYFAVVIMMWTFIVLINWRKRANFMAYRWGTMNYKEQETTRPQFKGDYTQDEITGEWVVTYPKWKRWLKYCISFPLTLFFTGGTLLLILWVHANRDIQLARYFQAEGDANKFHFDFALSAIGKKAPIVAVALTKEHLRNHQFWFIVVLLPAMLGLFLPLLNFILMRLSILLNDFENYRTESEYRTYLIIKVFSFRFVCYFAMLYYYAVLSMGNEAAIENGILRVGTGVLVYTTVAQWWQIFLQVCFPMLVRKLRMNHRHNRLADELRDIELEEEEICRLSATRRIDDSLKKRQARLINKRLLLEQAQDDVWLELMNPAHDSFPEYIQAVVQFTFVSCFSVVLPITPLIVLFNYLISMRLDAYKLCKGRRRPLAEKTGGIGVWEHVLHIVAVISVLTNCWLMGFTSSQFKGIKERVGSDLALFALVVGWEHIMLLIKYIMTTSMSTLPKSVRDAMKREQYELDKQRNTLMHERRKQQQQQEDDVENGREFSARLRRRSSKSKSVSAVEVANEDGCSDTSSRYDVLTPRLADV